MIHILYMSVLLCMSALAENRIAEYEANSKAQQFVKQKVESLEQKLQALLNHGSERAMANFILIQELLELDKIKNKNDGRSAASLPLLRQALLLFAKKYDLNKNLDSFAQQTNLTAALRD